MLLISAGSCITAMTDIVPPHLGQRQGFTSCTFARRRAHAFFRAAAPTSTASPAAVSTWTDAGWSPGSCPRPYQRSGALDFKAGRSFHGLRPRDE
jgi:hypothetical protein